LKCVNLIVLISTYGSICQKIYPDFQFDKVLKLENGNFMFRDSHSDGGSLVPGRSSGDTPSNIDRVSPAMISFSDSLDQFHYSSPQSYNGFLPLVWMVEQFKNSELNSISILVIGDFLVFDLCRGCCLFVNIQGREEVEPYLRGSLRRYGDIIRVAWIVSESAHFARP
jgi:hypothetical protein